MSPTKKDKNNPNKVFPTYVTRMKNKVELIETYIEEHTQVWTPRKSRQLDVMVEDLRAQFQKMETAWDTMREDVDRGTAYDGVEAKVNAAEASMLQAIRQAEEFQEEKEKEALEAANLIVKNQGSGQGAPPPGANGPAPIPPDIPGIQVDAPPAKSLKLDMALKTKNRLSRTMPWMNLVIGLKISRPI